MSRVTSLNYEVVDNRTRQWFWDFSTVFSSDLSPQAKLVRLCLASYADRDTRTANPSLSRLARDTGFSRSTVAKALNELEAKGWISRELRRLPNAGYDSTLYLLHDPPAAEVQEGVAGQQGSPLHGLPSPSHGLGSLQGGLPSPQHGLGVSEESKEFQGEARGGLSATETRVVRHTDYLVREVDKNKNISVCVVCNNISARETQLADPGSNTDNPPSPGEAEVASLALTLSAQLNVSNAEALSVAGSLLAKYPLRAVLAKVPVAVAQVREAGPIHNLAAFLAQAVEEDWRPPVAVERRAERREKGSGQDVDWKDSKYADLYLS